MEFLSPLVIKLDALNDVYAIAWDTDDWIDQRIMQRKFQAKYFTSIRITG
jgi:hypothetical protein